MKSPTLLFLLIFSAFFANAQFINLNKLVFKPGEQIIVSFSHETNLPGNAWIGILPASVKHGSEAVNDKYDITYQYLKNGTRGTLVFTAPRKEGKYDFRLNDSDNNGKEIAMTAFEVKKSGSSAVPISQNSGTSSGKPQSLKLQKSQFKPGETIYLQFAAPSSFASNAWVGIIPSTVQHGSEAINDQYDISYEYVKKRTSGTMQFKAPTKKGNYDFRMNDTDDKGKEIASVSFVVSNSADSGNSSSAIVSSTNKLEGTYKTDFNELTLYISGNRVTGTYKYKDGRVEGILNGNTLTGTWTQSNGKGQLVFVFNSNFSAFTGKWGYNNNKPTSTWNGHK